MSEAEKQELARRIVNATRERLRGRGVVLMPEEWAAFGVASRAAAAEGVDLEVWLQRGGE